MLRILSYLFPFWTLMPKAEKLGSVTFSSSPGVGWQCTIRPSSYGPKPRGINSWTGIAKTMGAALRAAMRLAEAQPEYRPQPQAYKPKLGGREFDPDTN
jgi:hypothetical protein